jgi:hypothetical protein
LSRRNASKLLDEELNPRACNSLVEEVPAAGGISHWTDDRWKAMEKLGYAKKVPYIEHGNKSGDNGGWILVKTLPVISKTEAVGPDKQLAFIPVELDSASLAQQMPDVAASPHGEVDLWHGTPHIASIEGITQGISPAIRVVDYRWTYELSKEAQRFAAAGEPGLDDLVRGTATFRKYDDGWRLETASSDTATLACR